MIELTLARGEKMKKRLIAILSVTCILLTGCTKENTDKKLDSKTYTVISIDEFLNIENENIEISNQDEQSGFNDMMSSEQTVRVLTLERN